MKSTHVPEMSGGIAEVTGELIIDTELRELQTVVATLATAVVANEESDVAVELLPQTAGATQKVKLLVTKGGTNHATAGDSAVNVHWLALGK
jgi:hypothetical protein